MSRPIARHRGAYRVLVDVARALFARTASPRHRLRAPLDTLARDLEPFGGSLSDYLFATPEVAR